jgi:probable rRNA maturation factor
MIDVEVFGLPATAGARTDVPDAAGVRELCIAAAARAGVRDAHLAVEFVDTSTIAALNAEHRAESHPTDVLSFPIDGAPAAADVPDEDLAADGDGEEGAGGEGEDGGEGGAEASVAVTSNEGAARARARARAGPRPRDPERELGDVIICIERTSDVREAIVHGVLHLAGMDHETDDGEMLALQREVLASTRSTAGEPAATHEVR